MNTFPKNSNAAWFAVRLMLGAVFVFHGSQKLFGAFGGPGIEGFAAYNESLGIPFPLLGAYLAGATEFFGGLMLVAGTGARLAAAPMIFTMLVASFTAHSGFDIQRGGMEYSLTLAVVLLAIAFGGPGAWTVDKGIARLRSAETGNASQRNQAEAT